MERFSGFSLLSDTAVAPEVAFGRLLIATLLGAVFGVERELRDRNAGLKTHMLVALASATFTILMIELFAAVRDMEGANADPIRIIEAVTAGVAFLAAGAIFRTGADVKGLTTGAGMWAAGAVGASTGAGFMTLAFISTAIAFLVLTVVRWLAARSRL